MNLTNRPGGIDILWANMKRQTEQDFELVIVDALWQEREDEVKAYINDPRLVYVRQNPKPEGAHTGLAHADNQGFRACSGELIVCLQDYIWIPPQGLEKYWYHHQRLEGKALIGGVGHQYGKPDASAIVDPQGKITVFGQPFTKRPEVITYADPHMRSDQGSFYECYPPDWELNWCCIPRAVIYELGGMDEQYDFEGFAYDNANIAMRADMLGYKTYLDQTNECMGFDHDGWWPNPLKVNRVSPAAYHVKVLSEMRAGTRPIRLNYLD
jgi:glycosyltransferase involved in cell wall biosynthesis